MIFFYFYAEHIVLGQTYILKRPCKFGKKKGKIKPKTNLQACKPMEFIHVVARWTSPRKVSLWARTKVRKGGRAIL